MRLSTNTIYEQNISAVLLQQESLQKTQQQVATGKRMQTPADDPVAAARVLEVTQTDSVNTQYAENRSNAKNSLSQTEIILNSISTLIQDVRTEAVAAGSATLNNSDRASIATGLRGRFEELIGLANATDTTGRYLFSGYQGTTKPFTQSVSGAQYSGDQGQRLVQVASSRQIAMSDSGTEIFERIKNGNGVFVTAASATNSGTGVVSSGLVVNPASLTGQSYQITFNVVAGVTNYDVVNTTTSTTLSTGNSYTSGSSINFDGLQFDIQGVPNNGDQFTVAPSTNPNQSLFKTFNDLIATLELPVTSGVSNTTLANGLKTALLNLDNGLDKILTVRAAVGTRLQEIDSLQSAGEDLGLQYQKSLSQLQDVDYARAISDLSRQQAYLEAAQKAFTKVAGLSIFNYI